MELINESCSYSKKVILSYSYTYLLTVRSYNKNLCVFTIAAAGSQHGTEKKIFRNFISFLFKKIYISEFFFVVTVATARLQHGQGGVHH